MREPLPFIVTYRNASVGFGCMGEVLHVCESERRCTVDRVHNNGIERKLFSHPDGCLFGG